MLSLVKSCYVFNITIKEQKDIMLKNCLSLQEVCSALWEVLSEEYLKFPSTEAEWRHISEEFMTNWDLPHVLGALDGEFKHKSNLFFF